MLAVKTDLNIIYTWLMGHVAPNKSICKTQIKRSERRCLENTNYEGFFSADDHACKMF